MQKAVLFVDGILLEEQNRQFPIHQLLSELVAAQQGKCFAVIFPDTAVLLAMAIFFCGARVVFHRSGWISGCA